MGMAPYSTSVSSLEIMAVTATYEGYLASTSLTCLGAKEPDHLTTCNTVESEKSAVCSKACRKRPEILQERDSRAKKHSTQHLLFCRIEGFNSHCSGELDDPVEMTVTVTVR